MKVLLILYKYYNVFIKILIIRCIIEFNKKFNANGKWLYMRINHFNMGREHSPVHNNQAEFYEKYAKLGLKKRELLQKYWSADRKEKRKIKSEVKALEEDIQSFMVQNHQHGNDFRRSNMTSYYRHIRFARPIMFVFNLLLWGLLFWISGVSTGIKIIILLFALASTFGNLYQLLFLLRVKDRILMPVEELKKGVDEIAKGNYNVEVEVKTPNEISELVTAFNSMAIKLKEDEQLKAEYENNRKTLIANISHDLKTPITSIQGYIEALLDRDDLTAEKKSVYLKIIVNNAEYMNRLIDDLFLFSKLDMQKLDFNFEEVKLRPFLHDMMEELNLDFEEKSIAFKYHDELKNECNASIDTRRFHQIIQNIMGNAVKYGPKEGLSIQVRLYRNDNNFCIDIEDNGLGIPKEKLDHIFERFYRVDSERTKDFDGTGLGLAIAKELIEAHGGQISASSSEGKGTCFTIIQPLLK